MYLDFECSKYTFFSINFLLNYGVGQIATDLMGHFNPDLVGQYAPDYALALQALLKTLVVRYLVWFLIVLSNCVDYVIVHSFQESNGDVPFFI